MKWLRRRRLIRDDDAPDPEPGALDACTETALGLGKLGTVDDAGKIEKPEKRDPDEARFGITGARSARAGSA